MSRKRKSRSTMETCFKILQLKFDKKLTNRCIGLTLHISASTIFEVLARFKASSLSWPLPADISHDTLEKLIFPPKDTFASELVMPDMLYFDTEMRKPGVTRQLLWMEYKAQAGDKAMGYSHFCRCYREWKKTRRLSMRQEHRAGEKLFIDFCGPTVPVINPDTGEIRRVAIFVAVMGASNYTYVEACEGQDMMSWLNAHSRCLTFLGGVPKLLIPDNLRSAVKRPIAMSLSSTTVIRHWLSTMARLSSRPDHANLKINQKQKTASSSSNDGFLPASVMKPSTRSGR